MKHYINTPIKTLLALAIWLVQGAYLPAQYIGKTIVLGSQQNANQKYVYAATDTVRLLPGFDIKPSVGNNLDAKIDKSLNVTPGTGTIVVADDVTDNPIGRAMNVSSAVGSLPGKIEINQLGAAIYNIPIDLPVGAGNMEPDLAIGYNSLGGDGILGTGWYLQGISSVSRAGERKYLDGITRSMSFTDSDRYEIDGQRIIGMALEKDPFTRVTLQGSGTDSWYKVESKDGTVREYGNTADSKMNTNRGICSWMLSKETDSNGNYITYTYSNTQGEVLLSSIAFAGNGLVAPTNTVTFVYKDRDDKWQGYIGGGAIAKRTKLLDNILITSQGTKIAKYSFTYAQTSAKASILYEITKEDAQGNKLNSSQFVWKFAKPQKVSEIYDRTDYNLNPSYAISFLGNFTNNAIKSVYNTDGVKYARIYNGAFITVSNLLLPRSDFYNNFDTYTTCTTVSSYFDAGTKQLKREEIDDIAAILPGDFDGDGITDIIVVTMEKGITDEEMLCESFNFYPPEEFGDVPDINVNLCLGNIGYKIHVLSGGKKEIAVLNFDDAGTPNVKTVDINNDNRTDFFVNSKAYTFNKTEKKFEVVATMVGLPSDKLRGSWGDFDDNGIQEYKEYPEPYLTGGQSAQSSAVVTTKGAVIGSGILNGNSKSDLIYMGYGFKEDYSGDSTTSLHCSVDGSAYYCWSESFTRGYEALTGDLNGDGFDDIAYFRTDTSTLSNNYFGTWAVSEKYTAKTFMGVVLFNHTAYDSSMGSKTWEDETFTPTVGYDTIVINKTVDVNTFVEDFSGSGIASVVSLGDKVFSFATGYNKPYMTGIIDGLNTKTSIGYTQLGSESPMVQYPLMSSTGPGLIATDIRTEDAFGNVKTTMYGLSNGLYNCNGKGFLGFQKMKVYTDGKGTSSENEIDTLTCDVVKQTSKELAHNGTTISQIVTEFASKTNPNGEFRYPAKSVQTNLLTGVVTETTSDYDDNGNLVTQTATSPGGYSVVTTNSDFTDAGSYIASKPQNISIKHSYPGAADYTSVTTINYDNRGNPYQKITNFGVTGKEVKVTTPANQFGLISSSKTEAGTDSITEYYTYDPTGRYLTQKANPLDTTDYVYKTDLGQLERETTNGLATTYTYGAFGKLASKTLPDGNTIVTNTRWDMGGSLYYTENKTDSLPWQRVYYDSWGQVTKEETVGFNYQPIVTTNIYNIDGTLKEKHLTKGSTETSVSYGYDDYERVTKTTPSVGPATTVTYSGSTVSTTTDGKTYSKTYDPLGQLLSTTEPQGGGGLTYTYNAQGKPVSISGPKTTVSMGYDAVGNQVSLSDPDAGLNAYVYDAWGRLTSQSENNVLKQSMVYDRLGRLDHKTDEVVKQTTYYRYVTSGNGRGQVASVRNGEATNTYVYDVFGRVVSTTDSIAAFTKTFAYSYNRQGNVRSITYPDGALTITRDYDALNNLVKVSHNNQALWQLTAADATNLMFTLGNGIATLREYNIDGTLKQITTTRGSNTIQNLAYNWNATTGNLDSRSDNRYNLMEAFRYDALDRLTSAKVNSLAEQTTTYQSDGTGNIAYQTGIGNLHYDGSKPHAVTEISEPESVATDFNNQTIQYTSFNKVSSIEANGLRMTFTYGTDQQRRKSVLTQNNNIVRTNYYSGLYEGSRYADTTKNRNYYYIEGGGEAVAVYIATHDSAGMYYLHKDHLGSLVSITNQNGAIVNEMAYDAWGNRRDPQTGNRLFIPAGTDAGLLLTRGYTGHEHLDEFGLINMNGRVYDPSVGRFLSPDNAVQAPDNSQSYNRYAYCMNNPLKYTDPTGYLWYRDNWGQWNYWDEPGSNDKDIDPSTLTSEEYTLSPTDRVLVCGFWNNGKFKLSDSFSYFNLYAVSLTDKGIQNKKDEEEKAKKEAQDKTQTKTDAEKRKEDIAFLKAKNGGGSGFTKVGSPEWYAKSSGRCDADGSEYFFLGATQLIKAGVTSLISTAAKSGTTIIGEGMARVEAAAAKVPGSVILNDMPAFTGSAEQVTSQMMQYNRQWILQQLRSGNTIIDIGLDINRTQPSIFYQMEQNMIKNYKLLHP